MTGLWAAESGVRLGAFLSVFAVVAAAEALWPRRGRAHGRWARWPSNLGIVLLDGLVVRLAAPLLPVAYAASLPSHSGLLSLTGMSHSATTVAAVVLLDLVITLQHLVFHASPSLWRLHRMHHADTDFDVTTALRFHPLEILLSVGVKLAAVAALGAPPEAVLIFEVLLNASAMFNHANLALPGWADRALRAMIVTPDMHRVHHSVRCGEMNANYGFCLSLWDRLLGTYVAAPVDGHAAMAIGLTAFREPSELRLDRLLTQPFRAAEGGRTCASGPGPMA